MCTTVLFSFLFLFFLADIQPWLSNFFFFFQFLRFVQRRIYYSRQEKYSIKYRFIKENVGSIFICQFRKVGEGTFLWGNGVFSLLKLKWDQSVLFLLFIGLYGETQAVFFFAFGLLQKASARTSNSLGNLLVSKILRKD